MGQAISIESKFCVKVPDSLLVEYTVVRTSGEVDSGWRIPLEWYEDDKYTYTFPSASKHGKSDRKGLENWRIFMYKGERNSQAYMYAWRRVNSIYPSELYGNEEAIQEWQDKTAILLEELEATRLAEGGTTPEDELKELSLKGIDVLARLAQSDAERWDSYEKEDAMKAIN